MTNDKPKADCTKCVTECRYRDWFEHEVRVGEIGCNMFKPIQPTNEEGEA